MSLIAAIAFFIIFFSALGKGRLLPAKDREQITKRREALKEEARKRKWGAKYYAPSSRQHD